MKILSNITYKAISRSHGIAEIVALVTVSFAVASIVIAMSVASGFRSILTEMILNKDGDYWLECRDSMMLTQQPQPIDSVFVSQLYQCNVIKAEPRLSAPIIILGDGEVSSVEIRSSNDIKSDGITISSLLAKKMSVEIGDTLDVMYSLKFPFSFPVKVDSLFECDIKELSESIGYASFLTVSKFRGLNNDYVDGYVVWGGDLHLLSNLIYPRQIWMYDSHERFAGIFDWLDVIDGNVWLVVAIMITVAVINMLAASLSIILENTKTIAILKSLGMPLSMIRLGILKKNLIISSVGATIGFVVALVFCIMQYSVHMISLPSSDYLVNFVPIQIDIILDIVATALTIIIISVMTLFVTMLINNLNEDTILKYE